jgi:drug/metabolite transporter (DMT)-like permease
MNGTARLQALAAALLFSTGGAAIKVAAFSAPQVSALRSGIAALALLVFLGRRITWSPAAVAIGLVYAATLTTFVAATKLTTSANAIFLQSTAPLYILLLAPLVLREPIHRRDVVYVAAIGAGMLCCFVGRPVSAGTAPDPATGNLLGVACSLAWAATLVALRWAERSDRHAGVGLSSVVAGNAIACAAALPFALPLPAAPPAAWATVAYLGVFQVGLAYVSLTAAMRHLPALDASLLLLLEPVLNPVWTWLVRGEDPGPWTIAGGVAIIASAAVKSIYDARVPAPATATMATKTG